MDLKISQKFVVAVAVPVVFELVLVGALLFLMAQADEARIREQQAKELASKTYTIFGLHIQRLCQLMIAKSSGDMQFYDKAKMNAGKMRAEISNIHDMIKKNDKANERWKRLYSTVMQIDHEYSDAYDAFQKGDRATAGMLYMQMQHHMEELLDICDSMTNLQATGDGMNTVKLTELLRFVLYLSLLMSLFIAFGLALYFNHGIANRLQVIMDNTRRMANGQPPSQSLRGNDELAQIDHLYHEMHDSLTILRRRERAILENVADVVCSIDSQIRFTDINEAALRLWGYQREILIGGCPVDVVANDDRDNVMKLLIQAIDKGENIQFECGVRRFDATIADTEWTVTWSKDERSLYCIIHDITARKHLDRLKREFVAMVSHEIRTPLTSISMTHSLLAEELGENLDEFMSRSLNVAQDNVNRLMALVNNLLDLDKLESGFIEFVADTINAEDVIESSSNAIDSLFRQKSIKVTRKVDPKLKIYADKERLIQVMINLLSNATKYSPNNSEITITAEREQEMVRISVADKGRGIPADKLQAVFERFRQVEKADEHVHKGTGLGLAISKAIVERHRGNIGVTSVEGAGTTFWFTVPATESMYESLNKDEKAASGTPT
jgi:PAS domain S-box